MTKKHGPKTVQKETAHHRRRDYETELVEN